MKSLRVYNILFIFAIILGIQFCYGIFPEPRIIGGEDVENFSHYPWFAFLALNILVPGSWPEDKLLCGGSIIAPTKVLTAAHCIHNFMPRNIIVYTGIHNSCSIYEPGRIRHEVLSFHIHPDFDQFLLIDYDAAIITLKTPTVYQPIALPSVDDPLPSPLVALGYGLISLEHLRVPCILQEVELDVFTQDYCQNAFEKIFPDYVDRNMTIFCAGDLLKGSDTCMGDSGGPLAAKDNNDTYVLYGIISFGEDCGNPKKPGFYTDVRRVVNWITETIAEANQNPYERILRLLRDHF